MGNTVVMARGKGGREGGEGGQRGAKGDREILLVAMGS